MPKNIDFIAFFNVFLCQRTISLIFLINADHKINLDTGYTFVLQTQFHLCRHIPADLLHHKEQLL